MKDVFMSLVFKRLATVVLVLLVTGVATSVFAAGTIDATALTSGLSTQGTAVKTIGNWIMGIILLIGVITVGYKMTSGKPEAKEGLVGWIGGVIFIGIAMALVNTLL